MPGVQCTRSLACENKKHTSIVTTGSPASHRHSLHNGFTAYSALSPATNSSCHRRRRIGGFAKPGWGSQNLRRLDTSNGCQDHTASPYAATPIVCAPLSLTSRSPPCDAVTRLTLPRPPHPAPTFVTMANAPLFGTEWLKLVEVICPTGQAKYFSRKGWT